MTNRSNRWRFAGVLVLMLGIVGMHSLVVAPGHSMAAPVSAHHASLDVKAADACDCGGHGGFHACVFVMTELLALVGLALLCWIGIAADVRMPARIRLALRHRQRAPPWTVLTLAEKSVLRI